MACPFTSDGEFETATNFFHSLFSSDFNKKSFSSIRLQMQEQPNQNGLYVTAGQTYHPESPRIR